MPSKTRLRQVDTSRIQRHKCLRGTLGRLPVAHFAKVSYPLHSLQVECISKGKTCRRHGLGVKVSVATIVKGGRALGMRAVSDHPHDGHTLAQTLEPMGVLIEAGTMPNTAIVDQGYQDVRLGHTTVLLCPMGLLVAARHRVLDRLGLISANRFGLKTELSRVDCLTVVNQQV
jgi:hypothetical protein